MERLSHIAAHLEGVLPAERARRLATSSAAAIPEEDRPLVITLIGAGNSGHVCAALFDGNTKGRVRLQLLTSRPDIWRTMRPVVRFPDGSTQRGLIHEVSTDPAELVPQ